jgi:hypothetical protein
MFASRHFSTAARAALIVGFLTLIASPHGASAQPAPADSTAPLRTGDTAPALTVQAWFLPSPDATPPLMRPSSAPPRPAPITVLIFWTTWSPTSRLVLAREDSLCTAHADGREQVIAITPEDSSVVRTFLKQAGWRHLAIGCDPAKTSFGRYCKESVLAQLEGPTVPVAVILGREPGASASPTDDSPERVLWMGPVADIMLEEPLEAFDDARRDILAGRYDLGAAVRVEREMERSLEIFPEIEQARAANDLDRLDALLEEVTRIRIAPGYANTLPGNMNGLAWQLATLERPTPRQLELAMRAAEIGLGAGGGKDAAFVDTHARVLHEMGQVEEAIAMQRRALELARGASNEADYRETLNAYLAEAGRPLESPAQQQPQAAGAADAQADRATWQGTLNDAFHRFGSPQQTVIVRPAAMADTASDRRWQRETEHTSARFFGHCPVRRPEEVIETEKRDRALILYGTPATNALTRDVLARVGIAITPDGVHVGGRALAVANPVLIVCVPNPWNPALPIRIYTAAREEDAFDGNRFFNGPTALVVGHWVDGSPEVVHSLDFAPSTPGQPALAVKLDASAETLSGEDAAEDIHELDGLLRTTYAGFADLEWKLRTEGSSWSARTTAFAGRCRAREQWPSADFFELLRDYLSPVQDAHFAMTGVGLVDEQHARPSTGFIHSLAPYFASATVTRREGKYWITPLPASLSDDSSAELLNVPLVGLPQSVREGQPYLFPTLPTRPRPLDGCQTETYLLGVLASEDDAPRELAISLRTQPSPDAPRHMSGREVSLPVHRAQAWARGQGPSWSLGRVTPDSLPLLAVRTMNPPQLTGLGASADSLRGLPRMLLDLRDNSGGGDSPAMEWCQRMSAQRFEWVGGVGRWPGRTDPLRSWFSFLGGPLQDVLPPDASRPVVPYNGELYIFADKQVASSGETFTHLARQIRGAVLLGENTAGCVSYGNVEPHGPLTHSRIRLQFGRSRFVPEWVRPTAEGIGFFPDYWLDDPDPVRVLSEYLERVDSAGRN